MQMARGPSPGNPISKGVGVNGRKIVAQNIKVKKQNA
jgi:hypothetical protein